jgi:hypothetical protein
MNRAETYDRPIPLILTESDLMHLGGTISQNHDSGEEKGYPSEGTCFILSSEVCNVEAILLRSIMTSLGYRVSEGEDFYWNTCDRCDLIVYTSYPWSRYLAMSQAKRSQPQSNSECKV